jgi:uncharacterized protein YdcH (DUF465 family)
MHIPHELQDEFPGEALFIERLIKSNYEFGQLATHYDEVNRQIYRISKRKKSRPPMRCSKGLRSSA